MITAPIGSPEYYQQLIDSATKAHTKRYGVVCCMVCKFEMLRVVTFSGELKFNFMDATDPATWDGTCHKCKAQVWPKTIEDKD